jgi:hypothetical protein
VSVADESVIGAPEQQPHFTEPSLMELTSPKSASKINLGNQPSKLTTMPESPAEPNQARIPQRSENILEEEDRELQEPQLAGKHAHAVKQTTINISIEKVHEYRFRKRNRCANKISSA